MDSVGSISVVWMDNHEAWQTSDPDETDDWDLCLRTTTLPADNLSRVAKHYYAPSTGSGHGNGQRIASRVDDGMNDELYYILHCTPLKRQALSFVKHPHG